MHGSRTEQALFALAIGVHLITAWCSSGFYADDEHYQVITFAEVKAGHEPESALPWEHAARIRSVVLPSVCLVVFAASDAIGLHDPFHKAFLLRLITAALALIIVRRWTRTASAFVPEHLHTVFLGLSWLLWFLPYQHVRFTGETWSGLLLLAALTELLTHPSGRIRLIRSGLLIGLAVLIRPPTLFMAMGLVAWMVFTERARLVELFPLGASAVLVHVIGAGLDTRWYGTPTWSLWNYVLVGIEGRPDGDLDGQPWWSYGPLMIKDMLVPIGLLVLAAYALHWRNHRTGPLLWIITPFVLFHLLIAHKETRFLFPLVDLVPLLLVQALASFPSKVPATTMRIALGLVLLAALIANAVGLAVVALAPAGSGRTRLAEALGPALSTVRYDASAATVWKIAVPVYYGGPSAPEHLLEDPCDRAPMLLVAQHGARCGEVQGSLVATADPAWANTLLSWYHWRPADRGWAAYRMAPTKE